MGSSVSFWRNIKIFGNFLREYLKFIDFRVLQVEKRRNH